MKLKMLLSIHLGICSTLLGVSGCDQINKPTPAIVPTLEIKRQLSQLENKMAEIDGKVSILNTKLTNDEAIISNIIQAVAEFKPGDNGYHILKTNLGNFPVFLKNTMKLHTGYKFTFMLGNPYSFVINDFEIIAMWNFYPTKAHLKYKTFKITKDILPAIWTEISIDLPTDGKVNIYFQPNTINFEGDYRKTIQKLEMIKLLQSI